jgi:hypothetical protein
MVIVYIGAERRSEQEQSKSRADIIEATPVATERRRKKSGDRTRDVTRV